MVADLAGLGPMPTLLISAQDAKPVGQGVVTRSGRTWLVLHSLTRLKLPAVHVLLTRQERLSYTRLHPVEEKPAISVDIATVSCHPVSTGLQNSLPKHMPSKPPHVLLLSKLHASRARQACCTFDAPCRCSYYHLMSALGLPMTALRPALAVKDKT